MRGTYQNFALQSEEVKIHYKRAKEKGDDTHADAIRHAHPDLTKQFDAIDREIVHA